MRPAAAVLALAMLAVPPAAAAQDLPFDADPAHSNAARQAKRFAHAGRDVDALVTAAAGRLWVKAPGESDGQCADGHHPAPGAWWPRYALGLIRRAGPPL